MIAPAPGIGTGAGEDVAGPPPSAPKGGVWPANLAANITGRAWSTLAVWLFTPLYVRYLGADAFGVVGLYIAVQSFIMIADTGLSPAVSREMARLSVMPGSRIEIRNLIRTLEVTLLATVLMLGVALELGAAAFARHMGRSGQFPLETLTSVVRLMIVAAALQVFSGLHMGALMGLQRHVAGNAILVGTGIVKGVGGALLLSVSPHVETFFLWQIAVNTFQAMVTAAVAWRSIPSGRWPRCDWPALRRVLPYAAGVAGISVTSTLLMQSDKFLIARLLDFESLGYYTLAFTVGTAPVVIAGPIAATFQPRFAQLVALRDEERLSSLYHRAAQIVSTAVFPVAAVLTFFGSGLLEAWLGNPLAAERVQALTPMLIAGSTMLAVTTAPYALELAYGWTRLPLTFNCIAAPIVLLALVALIRRHGAAGAAGAFLALNVSYLLIHIPLMHRRLLRCEKWRWYGLDLALPCAAVVVTVLAAKELLPPLTTRIETVGSAAAVWLAASAAAAFAGPETRPLARGALAAAFSFCRGYKP